MPFVSLADLVTGAQSGHLISFPTDTVPALAARPDRAQLIFEAKQRSQTKPLILMAAHIDEFWAYVKGSDAELKVWQQVATQYLPGALTLVLPASDRVPPQMNPSDPTTIGLRVPNSPIARYILARTHPLATTSANRSGEPPLETLTEIHAHFPDVLVPDPDELDALERTLNDHHTQLTQSTDRSPVRSSGVPSTVAKWTGTGWEILRQGGVKLEG